MQHTKTLIDLFFTSRPELYSSGVIQISFADHFAIVGVRKLHRIKSMLPKTVETRNYNNYDPKLFTTDLSYVPWDILEMALNLEAWNSFKDLFKSVADNHAPVNIRHICERSLPWITREVKDLMKECDYYHKKAIKTNQEVNWSSYKRLHNAITGKLWKEKSKYYSSKLTGKQDSKQLWRTLCDLLPKGERNTTSTRYQNLTANTFNQYFTQIARTLSKRFQNVSLPLIAKARVSQDFALNDV